MEHHPQNLFLVKKAAEKGVDFSLNSGLKGIPSFMLRLGKGLLDG